MDPITAQVIITISEKLHGATCVADLGLLNGMIKAFCVADLNCVFAVIAAFPVCN